MRRMYSKGQIEDIVKETASGGTQWYKHEVSIPIGDTSGPSVYIVFFSMFGDSLKDAQLSLGRRPAIITQASGPDAPNTEIFFPGIKVYTNGRFMINYVGTDGKSKQYEFNKSNISSDTVTAM